MAPDGKSLITSVGSRDQTVWLHDKDGDHPISSEGNTSLPRFSSDGNSLYFLKAIGQTGSDELWIKDLNSGKEERILTNYPMQEYSAARDVKQAYSVSRDGKEVAFSMKDQSGHTNLWIAPTNRRFSAERRSDLPRDRRRLELSLSHEDRWHRPPQDYFRTNSGYRFGVTGRPLGCCRVAQLRRRAPCHHEGVSCGWGRIGAVVRRLLRAQLGYDRKICLLFLPAIWFRQLCTAGNA
jgi:hypothetical protein